MERVYRVLNSGYSNKNDELQSTTFYATILWSFLFLSSSKKRGGEKKTAYSKVIQYRKFHVFTIDLNGREFSAFIYKIM